MYSGRQNRRAWTSLLITFLVGSKLHCSPFALLGGWYFHQPLYYTWAEVLGHHADQSNFKRGRQNFLFWRACKETPVLLLGRIVVTWGTEWWTYPSSIQMCSWDTLKDGVNWKFPATVCWLDCQRVATSGTPVSQVQRRGSHRTSRWLLQPRC